MHRTRTCAALLLSLLMVPVPPAAADTPEVPAEYQALYSQLDDWLTGFAATNAKAEKADTEPQWGVHLSASDANRGDFLAGPTANVDANLMLDMMQRLGIQGVTLMIGYPMLAADFPQSEAYRKYYIGVAEKVREQGLSLVVEQNLVAAGTQLSPHEFDFQSQSFEQLVAGHRTQAQWVIDNLKPDYLVIMNEPRSFAAVTNRSEFTVREGMVMFVNKVLEGLDRKTTKVGAGVSNVEEPEVAQAIAASDIDFFNLSGFDLRPQYIERAYEIAGIANAAGKPLLMAEAWAYKSSGEDKATPDSVAGLAEGLRRNAFGFWAPLDSRFLDEMMAFARNVGAVYVSPQWGNYLLGYVDYSAETANLPFDQLVLEHAKDKASKAVMSGWHSDTGKHYQQLLKP